MRPGRRVNQERMAQEHVAGLSRREHRRAVRAGAGRSLAGHHGARLGESPTQDVARSAKTIYLESR